MLPYHVYMDLDVINNDYISTTPPQLRFEETRNQPFLDGDSSDYFCSIVRFSIQTGNTLPVFIPRIQTGQSDVNKTVYKITLKYEKDAQLYYGIADVMYSPEDRTAPIPIPPLTQQGLTSTYYYVYNYQHFIDLVNDALFRAWQSIISSIGELSNWWNATVSPFLDIDTSRQTVVLHADKELFQ